MQQLNPVVSSVPGQGNKLVSLLRTGFIVDSETSKELYNFSRVDPRPFARFLTNMDDAGRIGNSWDFDARAVGLRVIKVGTTAPTADEIHDLKKYIASLEIFIKVGSDRKPAAEISGLQFIDPQEFSISAGTAPTQTAMVNPTSQKGEINLPVPVLIQRGWEMFAECKSNLSTVPATLRAQNEEWALQLFLVGFKQTY